ncbi:MAG: DUF6325 family protein [Candidatus Limnocylindrales bacterium]
MSLGPIELVVIYFAANRFKGEIAPALRRLVDDGAVVIIDCLFALKDEAGTLSVAEIDEVRDAFGDLDPMVSDLASLLTEDDAERLSMALAPDSSALLLLLEHRWATRFMDAVRSAGGQVAMAERIPRAVIEQLVAARETEMPEPTFAR